MPTKRKPMPKGRKIKPIGTAPSGRKPAKKKSPAKGSNLNRPKKRGPMKKGRKQR